MPIVGAGANLGSISGRDGEGGCAGADSVAAIDQAVADGVDVINFSISGTSTNFRDAVEIAFLFAADAGVFVAASAGNSGPTTATVSHPSPWITTVAAGTHARAGLGGVTLGNAANYAGASFAQTAVTAGLVDSVNVGRAGANAAEVELCFLGALEPVKVAGKIVVCKRGVNARTEKSEEVLAAGGVGMILYNSPDSSLAADLHWVPTVHVQSADGLAIKAYIAGVAASATATIQPSSLVQNATAPFTAAFSSRGPLRAGAGDLLEPDLIAPGQDIMAAVSPAGYNGRLFDILSGTSMSSPHVAGLAALLEHKHPTWSPMAIKSALMTSAGDVLDGPNTNPVVIFRQGAGHVRPNSAADPGLIYDSSFGDWLGFLCGTQLPTSFCTDAGVPVLDPSDLNSPSIAIGGLAGRQTVKRGVTNVSGKALTMTASVTGMTGIDVKVSPAPATAAIGVTGNVQLSFNGLVSGTKYLGSVAYGGAAGLPAPTIVRVDAP